MLKLCFFIRMKSIQHVYCFFELLHKVNVLLTMQNYGRKLSMQYRCCKGLQIQTMFFIIGFVQLFIRNSSLLHPMSISTHRNTHTEINFKNFIVNVVKKKTSLFFKTCHILKLDAPIIKKSSTREIYILHAYLHTTKSRISEMVSFVF